MSIPQPFQYQGSKRILAPQILRYLPRQFATLIEPFAGSAAISLACGSRQYAKRYWINDLNVPLVQLWNLIINRPEDLLDSYQELWRGEAKDAYEQFYAVRERFNRTRESTLLLYLLTRCIKGAVRYNNEGMFNQSPDKRRLGTRPETMRKNIMAVSQILRGKAIITGLDFRDVLESAGGDDVVYMDPPYQGTSGERDTRYLSGLSFDDFVTALDRLNSRGVRFIVSYDGRTGTKSYGDPLPSFLKLVQIDLEAGRSTQATLLGRNEQTVESLYISNSLAREIGLSKEPRAKHLVEAELF